MEAKRVPQIKGNYKNQVANLRRKKLHKSDLRSKDWHWKCRWDAKGKVAENNQDLIQKELHTYPEGCQQQPKSSQGIFRNTPWEQDRTSEGTGLLFGSTFDLKSIKIPS